MRSFPLGANPKGCGRDVPVPGLACQRVAGVSCFLLDPAPWGALCPISKTQVPSREMTQEALLDCMEQREAQLSQSPIKPTDDSSPATLWRFAVESEELAC